VIEASDRAGGRAHTVHHNNSALDLGAGWLHHGHKNSLLALAKSQNKSVEPVGLESFDTMQTAFDFETTCALFDTALEDAFQSDRDEPAGHFLNRDHPQAAAAAYWMCNIDMGTDPDKTSVMAWMNMVGDGENLFSQQGYGSIIEQGFQHVPLSLNSPVTMIDHAKDHVIIQTNTETITTKACICTVSMGVLNAGAISFEPELPAWKRRAFNDVQMGHLLKVHLEVKQPDILPQDTWVYVPDHNENLFFFHLRPAGAPWVVAYFGGTHAQDVGSKKESEVTDLLQDALSQQLGFRRSNVFGEVFFTDWASNPFTLGAYASHRPGEFPLNDNLIRPVGNKIFFAGEAFAGAYGQTVDGAFNSGQHTADEVARLLLG
jgi:monoamine oxidase